jgi:hypothetical protein
MFQSDFKEFDFTKAPLSSVFYKRVSSFVALDEKQTNLLEKADAQKRKQNDEKFNLKMKALSLL